MKLKLRNVKEKLNEIGIDVEEYTLRRKIDSYLSLPTRNQRTGHRDLTPAEIKKLCVALAIEQKVNDEALTKDFLDGKVEKVALLDSLINSSKVDMFLKGWIGEK